VSAIEATAAKPGATVTRGRSRRHRNTLVAWAFALPFSILFAAFTAGPVIASIAASVTDFSSSDTRSFWLIDFVGAENFTRLLSDDVFLRSLLNTFVFLVVGVPLTMVLGFALAIALNAGVGRLTGVFRVGFYVPVVANVIAVAVIWSFMLKPDGVINDMLGWFGIAGPDWLGDERFSLASVVALGVWRNVGTAMVLYLAGLQMLPRDVYEAADLDGAGRRVKLFRITLPMLAPTTLLISILLSSYFLQVFDEPFVLTRGGPLDSTMTVGYYIYNQFGFGNYGLASTGSLVLLVFIAIISVVQFRIWKPRT
jgi:multiple sugar transport system permease protein